MGGILLFIHLGSFAALLGGVISIFFLKLLVDKNLQHNQISPVLRIILTIDKLMVGPSAMVVALSGLGLAYVQNIFFGAIWLDTGIILWFLALIIAHLMAIPQLKRLTCAAGEGNWEIYRTASGIWVGSTIVLLSLLLVISGLMVWKP